jgi:hypothetical protein
MLAGACSGCFRDALFMCGGAGAPVFEARCWRHCRGCEALLIMLMLTVPALPPRLPLSPPLRSAAASQERDLEAPASPPCRRGRADSACSAAVAAAAATASASTSSSSKRVPMS